MTSPTTGRQGPRSIWFVIGGVLVALGIIGGIVVVVIGVQQVARTVDDYQRVSASAGGEFFIEDPGTYRIFYEAPGASDDSISTPLFDIVGPEESAVAVRNDPTSETYTFGSREGRKVAKFTAAIAGTYRLRVQRSDGLSVSGPQFAIGERGPTGSIFTIVGGVFGGFGVAAIGGAILIVAGVQRGRAKQRQLSPAPGWAAPPSWGGTQPGWAPPPPPPGSWGAPQASNEIPASAWDAPPPGGMVPQGTQWGAPPDPPTSATENPTPPGWAPPPMASPPPDPPALDSPPEETAPPPQGPIW